MKDEMPLPYGLTEECILALSSPVPDYLKVLEEETRACLPGAHMLTGGIQGRILAFLSLMLRPRRVLEIGTYSGYGILCLAEGLAGDGLAYTIEKSAATLSFARKHIAATPLAEKIICLEGEAAQVLPGLSETWDLVYLDADKSGNEGYLTALWPGLRTGGLILVDNVFARGGIRKPEAEMKTTERAVSALNGRLPGLLPGARVTNLPIRDGLTLILKTGLTI
jgi:caffeoyl-CoA O-methyltransferase